MLPLEAMNSLDENGVLIESAPSNHYLGKPFMGNGLKINKFSGDEIDRLLVQTVLEDANTPDMYNF